LKIYASFDTSPEYVHGAKGAGTEFPPSLLTNPPNKRSSLGDIAERLCPNLAVGTSPEASIVDHFICSEKRTILNT
jgi:hypothetical protein